MQKQAPTLGRILVMAGFALSCFGLLLYLWVAFGGGFPLKPQGYRFHVRFGEATQLAQQADVRISGVPVGKVVQLALGPGQTTDATIQMDERYAPIPRDAHAILRSKTLLGETYVELTPGNKSGGLLPEGATLPDAQVSRTVELDEIFRSLDPRTRQSFQIWMQSLAQGIGGRGQDLNSAFGNLAPFAEDTNVLLKQLNDQEQAVRQLVSNTGIVFNALSERTGQLTNLISSSNTVFGTIANRNQQLQDTFKAFPTFERESTLTLNRLDRFAREANPIITQLRPVARQLSPTLQAAGRFALPFRDFFVHLGPLITAAQPGLPAFRQFLADARPALGQLDPFTRSLNPFLGYIASFLPELDGFVGNIVASTQAIPPAGDAVHYLRTASVFSPDGLSIYPQRLATNRPNPYRFPNQLQQLRTGLPVFENRQCASGPRPVPSLPPDFASIVGGLSPDSAQLLLDFAFRNDPQNVPAPACRAQGATPGYGTDFPHLLAEPPGANASP
ncbi:MAG TPA: MlaD family protein [Conexibacter sp.]|jgi:phospholipid/cholesterol/gamma-HCH transport system substrate-binding protein|nr:MlaD family protein [Conexibacter sp.]